MSIRSVLLYPDSFLRTKAVEVSADEFNSEELFSIIRDLKDTLKSYRAEGLAATQISYEKAVCVITENDNPFVLINPEIISASGTVNSDEGCLSFPMVHQIVPRANVVDISAFLPNGEKVYHTFRGREAVAVQHEVDHLKGILFIDRMSKLKKKLLLKKYFKMKNKYSK